MPRDPARRLQPERRRSRREHGQRGDAPQREEGALEDPVGAAQEEQREQRADHRVGRHRTHPREPASTAARPCGADHPQQGRAEVAAEDEGEDGVGERLAVGI